MNHHARLLVGQSVVGLVGAEFLTKCSGRSIEVWNEYFDRQTVCQNFLKERKVTLYPYRSTCWETTYIKYMAEQDLVVRNNNQEARREKSIFVRQILIKGVSIFLLHEHCYNHLILVNDTFVRQIKIIVNMQMNMYIDKQIDRYIDSIVMMKCPDGSMEVNIPAPLGNYHRPTDRQTDKSGHREVYV